MPTEPTVVVRWLSAGMAEVPASDPWLTPLEAGWIARMRYAKRRSEFRLGRWTAKRALALALGLPDGVDALRRIEIGRAPDGAPAPALDGVPAPAAISMTDRADWAVCLVGPAHVALGCDLELVEPRSAAFVEDYFTPRERERVRAGTGAEERHLLANLIWSAKESALKVLRTGLRRDTRSVEVELGPDAGPGPWNRLVVRSVEGGTFPGWWQRSGPFLLTVAADVPLRPPEPLVAPPALATARPDHGWWSGP